MRFEEEVGLGFNAVMWLHEDVVDHVEGTTCFFALTASRTQERTMFLGLAGNTTGALDNEFERVVIEDFVGKKNLAELRQDEFTHIVRIVGLAS